MAPSSALERYMRPAIICSAVGAVCIIIPLLLWHMNGEDGRNEENDDWDPDTGERRGEPPVVVQPQRRDSSSKYFRGDKENPPPVPPRRPQTSQPPPPPRPGFASVLIPEQLQSLPSYLASGSFISFRQQPHRSPPPTLSLHISRDQLVDLDLPRRTRLPPSRSPSPISEHSSTPSTPSPTLSPEHPSTPPPASTSSPEPPWAPRRRSPNGSARNPPRSLNTAGELSSLELPPTHIPPRTPNVAGESRSSPNRPGTPPPSHRSWTESSSPLRPPTRGPRVSRATSTGSPTPGARRADHQRDRERPRRNGRQRWRRDVSL